MQRCHAFLATVLRVVPKAKSELFPILSSSSPFRARGEAELLHYYRGCLTVLRYHPGLQTSVLDMLVDKCLEMDVEIKISDLGEATLDKEDSIREEKQDIDATGVFELELDDSAQAQPSAAKEGRDDLAAVDEMANKLDALMLLLFDYISDQSLSLTFLYDIFVRVFESSILICYKSKFVQYLVFYLCGLHDRVAAVSDPASHSQPEPPVVLHRDFLSKLIQIVLDPYRATATRQSGACYVASFVSRAQYVAPETVCEAVSAMLRWAEAYLQSLDAEADAAQLREAGDVARRSAANRVVTADDAREQCHLHSLFYTVCQSAFYIMCFRGAEALSCFQDALESSHGDDELDLQHLDVSQQRWNNVCAHPTQPLRFCLESVRVEFLDLAETHSLLDPVVLDRLRQQERASSVGTNRKAANAIRTVATVEMERRSGGVGGLGRGQNPLDSFFPFDPYLLRRSYSFIDPYYVHWCGEAGKSGICASRDERNPANDAGAEAFENDDDQSRDSGAGNSSVGDEDDGSSRGSEDSDPDVGADQDDDSQIRPAGGQPMSFVPTSPGARLLPGSPDVATKREELRAAWTDTLKRSRAPSVENGSW
jgi:RNA polymerase I-specific transcription initiation factor RRN3